MLQSHLIFQHIDV